MFFLKNKREENHDNKLNPVILSLNEISNIIPLDFSIAFKDLK